MNKKQNIATSMLWICTAIIMWLTVFGRDVIHTSSFYFKPFHSFKAIRMQIKQYGLTGNLIGNIVLFLPIGILYPISSKKKMGWTIVIGFCLSLFIEIMQLTLHRGYFEIDDLICNSIGTGLGYLIQYMVFFLIVKKY